MPEHTANTPTQILFLPGALGKTQLWRPVDTLLNHPASKTHITWPGFDNAAPDPTIHGVDDLVRMVKARITQPTALVAQSMGGVVAMRVALNMPHLVTHLVLAATSGGVDVAGMGGSDWRPAFHAANPTLPRWFSLYQEDLTQRLPSITLPTLLIWGDADPISPVAVGQHLAGLLPRSQLHTIAGGDHNVAETHAALVAPLVQRHLTQ